MSRRFRGFLPVVVDVETAGFNPERDALLEVAAVILTMDDDGWVRRAETHVQQIDPFEGANLEQSALDFTGIDPWNPEREAVPEREGLSEIFFAWEIDFRRVRLPARSSKARRLCTTSTISEPEVRPIIIPPNS